MTIKYMILLASCAFVMTACKPQGEGWGRGGGPLNWDCWQQPATGNVVCHS